MQNACFFSIVILQSHTVRFGVNSAVAQNPSALVRLPKFKQHRENERDREKYMVPIVYYNFNQQQHVLETIYAPSIYIVRIIN
jgi:hypothetical protein